MITLTKEDLRIVGTIISSDKSMTRYMVAKKMKTYPQKISYRLDKLIQMGLIIQNNGDKATYKAHPIFDCPMHLKEIAGLIADVADIIDIHHPCDGEQLEAIIFFVLQRTSITKESGKNRNRQVCSGIDLQDD